MKKPNLFSYATSELSQDAFICWLLSWGAPEHKKSDFNLYECAISLITSFFDKHEITVPEKIEKSPLESKTTTLMYYVSLMTSTLS